MVFQEQGSGTFANNFSIFRVRITTLVEVCKKTRTP